MLHYTPQMRVKSRKREVGAKIRESPSKGAYANGSTILELTGADRDRIGGQAVRSGADADRPRRSGRTDDREHLTAERLPGGAFNKMMSSADQARRHAAIRAPFQSF